RGTGRLVALGVVGEAEGQGIGGALLEAACAFLSGAGCGRAVAAAHEYYTPGVDASRYPPAVPFLQKRGVVARGTAVAMGRPLYDLSWPGGAPGGGPPGGRRDRGAPLPAGGHLPPGGVLPGGVPHLDRVLPAQARRRPRRGRDGGRHPRPGGGRLLPAPRGRPRGPVRGRRRVP